MLAKLSRALFVKHSRLSNTPEGNHAAGPKLKRFGMTLTNFSRALFPESISVCLALHSVRFRSFASLGTDPQIAKVSCASLQRLPSTRDPKPKAQEVRDDSLKIIESFVCRHSWV